jgi:hypothetical protein
MPFFAQRKQGVSKLHLILAALQDWHDRGRLRMRVVQ